MNQQEKIAIAKVIDRYKGSLWDDQHCIFDLDGIDLEEYLWDFAKEICEIDRAESEIAAINDINSSIKDAFNNEGIVTDQLGRIERRIDRLHDVLFDTLGSALTGDALRALPTIATNLELIAEKIDEV